MTLGFVLIFLGAQLALVDSYLLTPRISNFLSQQGNIESVGQSQPANANQFRSPFNQASYGGGIPARQGNGIFVAQKKVSPPKWLCWPVLFCGTVVLLHGASMKRN